MILHVITIRMSSTRLVVGINDDVTHRSFPFDQTLKVC